eukprot:TRINITY_DN966_c2_g3_i1.p1 TRINITY_DN966_c2_g3~~TRINITY_DN966_c2_g3_i1.p1  ORF type:complete len:424 (-),score=52.22 TRINITY_DN966_c2_g3_i1:81-1352(-)
MVFDARICVLISFLTASTTSCIQLNALANEHIGLFDADLSVSNDSIVGRDNSSVSHAIFGKVTAQQVQSKSSTLHVLNQSDRVRSASREVKSAKGSQTDKSNINISHRDADSTMSTSSHQSNLGLSSTNRAKAIAPPKTKAVGKFKSIQILGMFDSGTNLMWSMLNQNLGSERTKELCPGGVKDKDRRAQASGCLWWKHMPPRFARRELRRANRGPVLILAMVRSPLAQLSSWQANPYDLGHSCLEDRRDQPNMLFTLRLNQSMAQENKQCIIGTSSIESFPDSMKSSEATSFHGLTELWNWYANGYSQLASSKLGDGHRAMVIEYERLIMQPSTVMKEVFKALGEEVDHSVWLSSEASKGENTSRGWFEAWSIIQEKRYTKTGTLGDASVRKFLCSRLNSTAMRRFRIPVQGKETYESDCKF